MIDLILKSMPMVVMNDDVNESSEYRNSKQDLPTPNGQEISERRLMKLGIYSIVPESPISKSLIK